MEVIGFCKTSKFGFQIRHFACDYGPKEWQSASVLQVQELSENYAGRRRIRNFCNCSIDFLPRATLLRALATPAPPEMNVPAAETIERTQLPEIKRLGVPVESLFLFPFTRTTIGRRERRRLRMGVFFRKIIAGIAKCRGTIGRRRIWMVLLT